MSTGQECMLLEREPGRWYLILEDGNCPRMASWIHDGYATAYGPFGSKDQTTEFLFRYFANPGGWSEEAYSEDRPARQIDEYIERLLTSAEKNKAELTRPNGYPRGRYPMGSW